MSFAPPNPTTDPTPTNRAPVVPPAPYPPAPNPAPGTSRSTPLPGFDDVPPPTAAQFLGAVQQPPVQPFQPAPGAALGSTMPRSRRSGLGGLVVALLIIGPVVGISVSVWAFLRGRDANEQAERVLDDAEATLDSVFADAQDALDDVDPVVPADISLPAVPAVPTDADVPPVSLPVSLPTVPAVPAASVPAPAVSLFDPAGATALIGTYEAAIGGAPTKLMNVTIYPDYAFATAQDPANALHVDEYPYRDGFVGASSPVTLVGDGDLEANLFATTDVDWTFLSRAVGEAPSLMPTVEEGVVTHIIVERSVFTPDFSVVVRVYVSVPRGGGYVEYTAAGELVQVMV
ncbi:MAG: hypothetical protein NTZ21_04595 [Actinobacteria bacterium]|nr:hypothetical protein [Actinomycetota bacterium]